MMTSHIFIAVFVAALIQNGLVANAILAPQTGYPSYGSGYSGDGSCAPLCAPSCPSPPIQFWPMPQPLPVRVPSQKPQQSVTIPNIILALLPPTSKPSSPPQQVCQSCPQPLVVPLPQPYAVPCGGC